MAQIFLPKRYKPSKHAKVVQPEIAPYYFDKTSY